MQQEHWGLWFNLMSLERIQTVALLFLVACDGAKLPVQTNPDLGGGTTVYDRGADAFSRPASNLRGERRGQFFVGNSFFNTNWVTAPASTTGLDGLGPIFNAVSCASCHFKDGRGAPPLSASPLEPKGGFLGLLLRLSVPDPNTMGGAIDEPNYGGQFNHRSIVGVPSEGEATVEYVLEEETLADGTVVMMHRPVYAFERLSFGPLHPEVMISARVAPSMIGLGLLETIDERTILAFADEGDQDGDGISGRPNWVFDHQQNKVVLGRFGWKSNQPNLREQNAAAFLGDIGLTTTLFQQQNCPMVQLECISAMTGSKAMGEPEVTDNILDAVTHYSKLLAVPAQRNANDTVVQNGAELFEQIGCANCHRTQMTTGVDLDFPELSEQTIRPYTDLLLHDLGEGLADHRPDAEATGSEWRTSPLWGIGLIQRVNGHDRLLHDGRAHGMVEAILWHGGEAEDAKHQFRNLSRQNRETLLEFLNSL